MADYRRPILAEIYTETAYRGGSLAPEHFFEVVPRLKELGFGDVELGEQRAISVNVREQVVQQSQRPRVRCWNDDKTRLVQLAPDVVVINLVGEYPGWELYLDLFEHVHSAMRSAVAGLQVESISLHTIDRFAVPASGFRVADYLAADGRILPRWYGDYGGAMDVALEKGVLQEDGFNTSAKVSVRVSELANIELRATFRERSRPGEDLAGVLKRLHAASSETFESLITQRTRDDVMGGLKDAGS